MPNRTAAKPLRVRLFGEPSVLLPDGRALVLERRAAALVALAAFEPGFARERAARWLWPDSADPRRNLRQQLLRFRQGIEAPLFADGEALTLAAGVQVVEALPGAEVIVGLDFTDCPEFADWLHARRQGERQTQMVRLREQLAEAQTQGDLDTALSLAEALLACDSDSEAHHRELMRVHYLRGDAAAGLTTYRRLSDMLAANHGTRPSSASKQLADVLLTNGQEHEHASTALTSAALRHALPVTLKRPPLLAGRDNERAAVLKHWAEGRAVLLEGEAGLGKSRLMADLLSGQGSALYATGRPGDAGTPYATLVRLLLPLLDGADGSTGLDASTRETLVHVAPVSTSHAVKVLPALRPGEMIVAVSALLQQRGVPLVALDDLHFADEATLELIAGLATPTDTPRRWLLAGRPAELPPAAQALRSSLAELLRLGVVTLTALDETAIKTLVDGLAIHGLQGSALAAPLSRHTGGNPLFLLETLKQGLVDGSLARGELPRPKSVGSLIEHRLQRLSESALTLARVAAIAGVDFSIELAESAIGVRAVQLSTSWSELQDAQVLRDESFAHDLVCDAVLRGVPPVVARRVHAQCAQWLAQHGGAPSRVAYHWLDGGRPEAAAEAFEEAAQRARVTARQGEEADLYALAAQAYGAAGLVEARFDALASHVAALVAARADDAALREARALPDQAHNDHQRARALRILADMIGRRGEVEESLALAQAGMALAKRIGNQIEFVRLASIASANWCKTGRGAQAYSLMLPLRAWVDAEADDALRTIWYGDWSSLLGHVGRLRESVDSHDVVIASAERGGDKPVSMIARLNQSIILRSMGALERAFGASHRALALASDEDVNAEHQMARLVHARNEAETGRFATATPALDKLVQFFETMGAPFWVHASRAAQARLWQHLGQHARALQVLQLDDTGLPGWVQAGRLWLRLEVEHWLGLRLAQEPVQQALALLDGDPNRRTGNAARSLRFAPPALVLQQAAELATSARSLEVSGVLATVHMHSARAANTLQRHDEAVAAAHSLVGLLHEGYMPDCVYTPEAWLVASVAFQAAGDTLAAQAALAAGQHWVRTQALPQVPAPFIDSFLHRNPVNRALLTGGGD